MTTKTKLPKLKPCPVCGRSPEVIAPTLPGMWARVECCQSTASSYHEIVALCRTPIAAAKRWNKMVGK